MKKKKKHKKKKKGKSLNYKMIVTIGGIFHLIVYFLIDLTFYSDTLFWLSLIIGGIILGVYFIRKMELWNPKSYRKIEGIKLKLYISAITLIFFIGSSLIFGNILNGTLIGLNYLGKNSDLKSSEFNIEKIVQTKTSGRKRIRRNNPRVYYEKNGKIISRDLTEKYSLNKNYSEFKTIEFITCKGLLGFDILKSYELKK